MRSILSLLGGISISAAGLLVVVRSAYDLAGVLLIAAGVLVSMLAMRVLVAQPRTEERPTISGRRTT
ncbi:MAG TPA: hypothetical protein VEW45_08995 [Candidatus Dormibacteraeota bacterium]|nr:hypothetical protein [Candidatus Dormibacteraeota bacterium]